MKSLQTVLIIFSLLILGSVHAQNPNAGLQILLQSNSINNIPISVTITLKRPGIDSTTFKMESLGELIVSGKMLRSSITLAEYLMDSINKVNPEDPEIQEGSKKIMTLLKLYVKMQNLQIIRYNENTEMMEKILIGVSKEGSSSEVLAAFIKIKEANKLYLVEMQADIDWANKKIEEKTIQSTRL